MSALVTWWSGTPNSLYGNRFEGAQFDTQNVVPVADALFGVAVGLAAGAWWRRVVPALASGIALYIGVRLVTAVYLRPSFGALHTALVVPNADKPLGSGSWNVGRRLLDPHGHAVPDGRFPVPHTCETALAAGPVGKVDPMASCLAHLGYRDQVQFHPASQYWHFQWSEALFFVALARCSSASPTGGRQRQDA